MEADRRLIECRVNIVGSIIYAPSSSWNCVEVNLEELVLFCNEYSYSLDKLAKDTLSATIESKAHRDHS